MGPNLGRVPDTLIYPQHDYFTYHQPFWVYLYREEGVAFNDLTSEDAHKAFGRFAKEYNEGRLEHPYYYSKSKSHSSSSDSFPKQVLDECKTTQHSWSFQTTATERKGLQVLQEGVRHQTEYSQQQQDKQASASMSSIISPAQRLLEERLQERRANKRLKDHVKTVHEELSGGAKDLRERKLEQRRQQANRIHGAARQKEEALGGIELDDAALYGSSSTQNHHNNSHNNSEEAAFQKALAKQRAHKAQRQEERTHRIEELQQKEKERQENMMKMLGLQGLMKSGQKIKIAPRNPAEPRKGIAYRW